MSGDRVAAERRPEPVRPAATPDDLSARTTVPAQGGAPRQEAAGRPAPPLPAPEAQGCLYALSQPPLMLFLLVIGGLLGLGAAYDLIFL